MPEKRSKYDTDPLDPDFARRTDEVMGRTADVQDPEGTVHLPRGPAEEQTRRFDEQTPESYPSVFIPPTYQPPRPQPFTGFGAGPGQPPAQVGPPPPGPSSPYQPFAPPSSRTTSLLGLPAHVVNAAPYFPFYVGLVAALVELLLVPRTETRARFHASQGLALQLAIVAGSILFKIIALATGSGFGGFLFSLAAFVFLVVSTIRVLQGKPHHIATLDEATRQLNERISPVK
ncbi:MAG TPA: hypothetical protein VFA21_18530 [Pyrinomonadaceae bacterium]|nr:hypothetical protein [Pyrinomonadaceae bacterium]